MQRLDLIRGIRLSGVLIAVAAGCLLAHLAAAERGAAGEKPVIPLIVMDEVPLTDAIKNLATQAGINYILDPRLNPGYYVGPDGNPFPGPSITGRWENVTAKEALTRMLQEYGIHFIQDSNTTIARISRSKEPPRQAGIDLAAGGTNGFVPLVLFEYVPLDIALQQLAKRAELKVNFDPELVAASNKRSIHLMLVSLRWEKVTAKQALAALLNNYDLVAVPSGAAGDDSLTIKASIGATQKMPGNEGSSGK